MEDLRLRLPVASSGRHLEQIDRTRKPPSRLAEEVGSTRKPPNTTIADCQGKQIAGLLIRSTVVFPAKTSTVLYPLSLRRESLPRSLSPQRRLLLFHNTYLLSLFSAQTLLSVSTHCFPMWHPQRTANTLSAFTDVSAH